jgi:hypothetical protein
VQALTRRKHGHKSPVIRIADLAIDTAGARCAPQRRAGLLTHREYQLLELLALREGQTVSRMEIEEHLYGSRTPAQQRGGLRGLQHPPKLKECGDLISDPHPTASCYVLSAEAP